MVVRQTALEIYASAGSPVTIGFGTGDTLYYKGDPSVSTVSFDGTLTTNQSVTISAPTWVISGGRTYVGISDQSITHGLTPYAQSILASGSAAGTRTVLGLGTIATQDSSNVAVTGGAVTGITDVAVADGGTGASTAATARSNLGVGDVELSTVTTASVAASATTVAVRSSSPAAYGYIAIEPFSTSCEIRRISSVSGSTITLTTALSAAHGSGVRVLFFQGDVVASSWFGAKGDGSTDDTIALQKGFDECQPHNIRLDGGSRTFIVSTPVLWGPSQDVIHMQIKAKSSFAPADTTNAVVMNYGQSALTFTATASDDTFTTPTAHGLSGDGNGVVFTGTSLPTGVIAGRLYFVRDRTTTTFKVAATIGGAAIDLTTDGSGRVYTQSVSLSKVYVDDVLINGNNVTGINGAMLYLQQQSELKKFRTTSCPGVGLYYIGQQAVFYNFECNSCGKALVLDNASFAYFFGTDIESFTTQGIHIVTAAESVASYGGGAFACGFWGLHMECNNNASAVFMDQEGSHHQISYDNVNISGNTNGAKAWYVHTGSAALSGYSIKNVRFVMGGSANRPTAISDTDRSITLDAWDDFRAHIQQFEAPLLPSSDASTDPQEIMIAGTLGRYIKYGGTTSGTPTMTMQPSSAQTAAQSLWKTSAGADATWVNKGGYLFTALNSAPADGDLSAGQAALWFDQTNSAAKIKWKAKQADGTVETGTLPLFQAADTTAQATTASTQTTPYGFSTQAQADAIATHLNDIRTCLRNAGLMA